MSSRRGSMNRQGDLNGCDFLTVQECNADRGAQLPSPVAPRIQRYSRRSHSLIEFGLSAFPDQLTGLANSDRANQARLVRPVHCHRCEPRVPSATH